MLQIRETYIALVRMRITSSISWPGRAPLAWVGSYATQFSSVRKRTLTAVSENAYFGTWDYTHEFRECTTGSWRVRKWHCFRLFPDITVWQKSMERYFYQSLNILWFIIYQSFVLAQWRERWKNPTFFRLIYFFLKLRFAVFFTNNLIISPKIIIMTSLTNSSPLIQRSNYFIWWFLRRDIVVHPRHFYSGFA